MNIKKLLTNTALLGLFLFPMIYGALTDQKLEEAKEVAEAIHSRDFAARQVCGPESSWRWDGDDLTCLMHTGRKTGAIVVAGVGK